MTGVEGEEEERDTIFGVLLFSLLLLVLFQYSTAFKSFDLPDSVQSFNFCCVGDNDKDKDDDEADVAFDVAAVDDLLV